MDNEDFWLGIKDEKILQHVRDSDLIGKCIKVAQMGEKYEKVHDWNTEFRAKHKVGQLEVSFEEGLNYQGSGGFTVRCGKDVVFSGSVANNPGSEDRIAVRIQVPPVNIERSYIVQAYKPGEWEEQLVRLTL